jgi:iron complex outermembrane receptor protein
MSVEKANAQNPAANVSSQPTALEEIIVTARRREEKLQSVPIAITAVSGQALTDHTIENPTDLSKLAPAMTSVMTNRDLEGYTIRGQTDSGAAAAGQSNAVTPYFAEVPLITGDGGGPGRYFDLENVQVLQGPQGTLFGQNSTGGAILFQPRKPTNILEGYLQAQFGNYGDKEFESALNVPLVDDELLLRVAGKRGTRDGFTQDLTHNADLDNRDYWAGRVSLTYRPTADFENYVVYDSVYSNTNGSSEIVGALNPEFLGAQTAQYYLDLQARLGARAQYSSVGVPGISKYYSWGIVDIARWDVSETVTLRSIFGYREFKQLLRSDFDGTPLDLLDYRTPGGWQINLSQYSVEPQLQGKSLNDKLTWTVGAFLLFGHTIGFSGNETGEFGVTAINSTHPTERSQAVYAQATYDFGDITPALDGLKFTAGYRFTWDYRALDAAGELALPVGGKNIPLGICTIAGLNYPNCGFSESKNFNEPTWTLGLDYQVTPDVLLYATGRRGFRAGGINTQALQLNTLSFKPEVVKDIELGAKTTWSLWGMRGLTNIALFRDDYQNAQAFEPYSLEVGGNLETTSLVVNAGQATIQGGEISITVQPVPDLDLTAVYDHTDARFDTFILFGSNGAPNMNLTGQPFFGVPQNKYTLIGTYHFSFIPEEYGFLSFTATYASQSHQYLNNTPQDPAFAEIGPGYSTLDLRLNWTDVLGAPLDGSLFATNVTDTVYRIGGYPVYSAAGFASFVYGEPQMWGVQLKYHFSSPSEPEAAPAPYVPPPVAAPAPAPKSYLVFFNFDKSDLTPQAVEIVDTAAKNAQAGKVTRLTVTGHTDTVGSDAYNMRLSRRRAESVAAQLEKDGIPSSEIEIVAKGKRDLLVPTGDGVREPQNRRVQIVFGSKPAS